jgi:hypothetical protein
LGIQRLIRWRFDVVTKLNWTRKLIWPTTMSDSSFEDTEKGARHSKDIDSPHLTQQQEDLLEAAEPPFTVHDHDAEGHSAELRKVATGTSMHRVASSKPSINNIRSVPNGGTKAWLQVLASFFLFFNSWGIVNTFGKCLLSSRQQPLVSY